LVGAERGGLLVPALDVRWIGRRRQSGKAGRRDGAVGGLSGTARELSQSVGLDAIRRGDSDLAVADDAERDDDVVDQRRLMDLAAGEPRKARALRQDDRLGLVARGGVDRVLRDGQSAHDLIPTCTPRNRAGDVPCETCAPCPGCPLPQFVTPCSTHSSGPATPSSEPQKTGVIPVYVASRSIRPSLPSRISQANCVPNWKFSRLSSIDQLLLVSR